MILDAGGLGVLQRKGPKIGGFLQTARNIETPVFGGLFFFPLQHPVQILSWFFCGQRGFSWHLLLYLHGFSLDNIRWVHLRLDGSSRFFFEVGRCSTLI